MTLTFRYTGGWNEMKGVRVLVDAVRSLPAGDWRVVAHDIDDFLVANDISLAGLAVETVPSFAPSEAAAVWAQTDVLLVPSIMRESHSLVTREALTAGVPVICTDTLGPEEVVIHGVNGMVVPAADVDALADAMRRFIDDPSLAATMHAACHTIPVRPIQDQIDGLLALYAELVSPEARKHGRGETSSLPRRVLFVVGIDGAPLRYRAFLPAEALALLGVQTDVRYYRDESVPDLARGADAIVVYRVPATREVLDLIVEARARGVVVLYDVDDLIFDPDLAAEIPALSILPPDEAALWLEGVRRYRTTMEACDGFVGSTAQLCAHAAAVTGLPTYRFANGAGVLVSQQSDAALRKPRSPGPLRVGYLSGTNTHDHDWALVEPALVDVLRAHRDVELWLVGMVTPSPALDEFTSRVKRVGFTPWTALPKVLRDLDVNLAPLTADSRFNEAKSAIKWLEAALVATPTVASPTEPFREAIVHGENGLLAATTDEWRAALDSVLTDATLRRRLGSRARRDALLRWSPHLQAHAYADILATAHPARRSSTWTDVVAPSEPYITRPLERYELPRRWSVVLPPPVRMQYRRLRALLWRSYRTLRRYGPVGVAKRAPSAPAPSDKIEGVSRLAVRLFAAAALLASALGVVTAFAPPAGAAPSSFHIEGGGFGHGVGMSQYGALGYAQQGWAYPDILKHYFTGVDITSVTPKVPRIQIGDDNTSPADLTVTPSAHVNIVLQGNVVAGAEKDQQIVVTVTNGKFNVSVAGNPVLNQVGGGTDNLYIQYNLSPVAVADTGHSYKYGQLELNAPAATELKSTITDMTMNEYLRGLGEVPSSWLVNALKAQVLAARSYAEYKLDHGATFLYGDVRDQNYVGYDKETNSGGANWVNAVNDTGNEMVTYQGAVAQTFYSSSSGGYTENSENVFSATVPYLKGVPDPYDSANGQNSLHTWRRDWTLAQMQSFVNSNSATAVGTLQSVEFLLPLGVSGRVVKVIDANRGGVRIVGSDATKRVSGPTFQSIINAAPGSTAASNNSFPLPSTLMSIGGASPYGAAFTGGVFVAAGHLSSSDVDRVVTGADKGGGPHVRVLDTNGDTTGVEFMAYDPRFSGGVRVAVCHFGDDATDSIVTAPGPGGGPHVRVFNANGSPYSGGFMAYDPGFSGGVYVGCGDVDPTNPGDEIITGPGAGGGPHIRVFDRDGGLRGQFMAYDPRFTGGVRVAGSGANVVTGPGPGGGPHVRLFNLVGTEMGGWMAYDPSFTGGVYVAGGNVTGDALEEVITGAGDPGGPHVRVFGPTGNEITGFMAFQTSSDHGARVAAARVPGGAIVAGSGTGGPSLMRVVVL